MANLVFDFLHNYHAGERRDSDPANAYQYDEGHVIEAVVPVVVTSCEIHYWIRGMEEAEAYVPDSITPNADGTCTILGHVPNEYFQTNGELRVYIVVTDGDASLTTYEGRIQVCHRSMPDDYVDDDPENEATRVLTEAQEAAATATAAAETCEEVLESIPEDYSTLSDDVSDLKDGLSDMDDRVTALEQGGSGSGLTDDIKQALLQLAEKMAYIDEDGQDYYNDLHDALYPPAPLASISAVYSGGTVYTTTPLNDLRNDLVVTATYEDSTTEVVTSYTLSGTLVAGTNTITVSYGGLNTTFTVTATAYTTDPSIAEYNKSLSSSSGIVNMTGACITNVYEYTLDIAALKASSKYDATNDYMNTAGSIFKVIYKLPNSESVSFSAKNKCWLVDQSGNMLTYMSTTMDTSEHTYQENRYLTSLLNTVDGYMGVRFTLCTADIDDSYAYWSSTASGVLPVGVSEGDIIFAGANTPYYGLHNISEATT